MHRYFKYLLFLVFVLAIGLIVFLQVNSNNSINSLIGSNNVLMKHLGVKAGLENLRGDVLSMESRLRGAVISGNLTDSFNLSKDRAAMHRSLKNLEGEHLDLRLQPDLDRLRVLVDKKIAFTQLIIDSFNAGGKLAAERLISTRHGSGLTDTINKEIRFIDGQHQKAVVNVIEQADKNGMKAKTMGTLMAAIAALASIVTFAYVSVRMNQQQKHIAAQEKFLANMSHEIRTPLNAILGFTHLLNRQPLDNASREYTDAIHRAGENLNLIVNDVLDLSKLEAGMMRLEKIPFSVRELVQSVSIMFHGKTEEKRLRFHTELDAQLPDVLDGDPTRLTQILVNLLGNAFKFTEKGSVSLVVKASDITPDEAILHFEVTDTGIGITEAQQEHIFDRFRQAEDTINRKYGGTGLGLTIVKELVAIQGGKISVSSTPGYGTTFHLRIPYQVSAEKKPEMQHLQPLSDKIAAGSRLLIAEDNTLNQKLLQHLLGGWQIAYDMAGDGKEAIQLLRTRPYSLILMDIQMPVLDGYSASRKIRTELKVDTPIIAMTAHALSGEKENCIAAGMNDYISKPLDEQQLYRMLQTYLQLATPAAGEIFTGTASLYRVINLQYMHQVSQGDLVFERTVTHEFIEGVEEELLQLQGAIAGNDLPNASRLAHNLKTTVSIMGLNARIDPWLDVIEHHTGDTDLTAAVTELHNICSEAIAEAKQFIDSLPK